MAATDYSILHDVCDRNTVGSKSTNQCVIKVQITYFILLTSQILSKRQNKGHF